MPNTQQIEIEIQAVEALYNFLVDQICNQINGVNARFCGYIDIMAETGIPAEECTRYTNDFYAVDDANLKKIYNRIVESDLPQICNYLEDLVSQFEYATNNSYGGLNLHYPEPIASQTPSGASVRSGNYQDYGEQIDAICDFISFLVQERNNLLATIQTYKSYCINMSENGVPIQLVEHYVGNYATPNVGFITNQIIAHLQENDYKQLTGMYDGVAKSMGRIGLNPSRQPQSM